METEQKSSKLLESWFLADWLGRWRDRSECLLRKKGNTQAIFSAFFCPSYNSFSGLLWQCGFVCCSYNLRMVFTTSLKNVIGILRCIELNLHMAWVLKYFNNIKSSNPWKWNSFPFTCSMSSISLMNVFQHRALLLS